MFTSRAERRMILRQDNARYRLLAAADYLGVAPKVCREQTHLFEQQITEELERLNRVRVLGQTLFSLLSRPGNRYTDIQIGNNGMLESWNNGKTEQREHTQEKPENTNVQHPTLNIQPPIQTRLGQTLNPEPRTLNPDTFTPDVIDQIELRVKYAGYIAQEEKAAIRAKGQESVKIPAWLDYWKIPSLRYECREKLSKVKPENLGEAARIPGVNPPDIAVLSLLIKRGHH
jgi:tRNA uridine 5-carboxymethylaminomethyl modification enzyme